MSHHRYPRIILNVADEAVTSTRDHQVDVPVHIEQRRDLRSSLDSLDVRRWELGLRETCRDGFCEEDGCPVGFFASFKDRCVA